MRKRKSADDLITFLGKGGKGRKKKEEEAGGGALSAFCNFVRTHKSAEGGGDFWGSGEEIDRIRRKRSLYLARDGIVRKKIKSNLSKFAFLVYNIKCG